MQQAEQPQPPLQTLDAEAIRARLTQLQRRQADAPEAMPTFASLLGTAAVLESFEVGKLFSAHQQEPGGPLLKALLDRCHVGEDGRWRLGMQARRSALRSIGGREAIREVRGKAEPLAPSNATQRAMDRILLTDEAVPVATLHSEEAAGLLTVADWFDGIVENLPDRHQLSAQLSREKLLHPMRRLTGDSFVGRTAEMAKLADYVGVLPPTAALGIDALGQGRRFVYKAWRSFRDNPPVYIAGPGGVGKSSLVANFILQHVSADDREHLPFVILDFDRAQVDSDEPLSLLIAATQQLKAQYPAHAARLNRMAEQLAYRAGPQVAQIESTKTDSLQGELVAAFAAVVREVLGADDSRPLLWVLDTFEEPQRKGASVVGAIWELLTQLQAQLDFLRVVVCGRVVPQSFPWDVVSLAEFDAPSAQAYLTKRLAAIGGPALSPDEVRAVINAVGLTPLALRLAARLVSDAGADALASVGKRRLLFFSMRSDQIQAALFHRILEHVRVIDRSLSAPAKRELEAKLRRLAFPGLAVRRVTPAVIEQVLARPCDIRLAPGEAQTLFEQLGRQVDIVETNELDPEAALTHRSDVRRMMLKDLEEHAGAETIAAINRAAVRYYSVLAGVHERAEEIYHRLRLSQSPQSILERWLPGVEKYLSGALDDIASPAVRVFLATQIGITLEGEILQGADLGQWESQALLRAERYIAAGNPQRALEVLRERSARLPASELLRAEAQALHLALEEEAALAMAQRGLDEALAAGQLSNVIELALLASQIAESMARLAQAFEFAQQAEQWAQQRASADDAIRLLQAQVAQLRLGRMSNLLAKAETARAALVRNIAEVPRATLRTRPALVRELVAEVGADDLGLLQFGVELLGVDLQWDDIEPLIGALQTWSDDAASRQSEALSAVAWSFGVTRGSPAGPAALPTTEQWHAWLQDEGNRQVGRLLSALLKAIPPSDATVATIVKLFDADANRRIRRESKARLV